MDLRVAYEQTYATTLQAFRSVITDLTPSAVEYVAALCYRTDNGGLMEPARHHRIWLDLMCDSDIKQLLILAPPEAAKTSWVQAFTATYIGLYPEHNIIFASSTGHVAAKRSQSLRNTIESQFWRELFPTVERATGMKWLDEEWSVAPNGTPYPGRLHPTVAAYGTGGSITGSRADLLIGDDILDFENSRTPTGREYVKQWMHNSFLTRRKSTTGRTIIVGTMWNAADLYSSLKSQGDWVVCRMPLQASERDDGYYVTIEYPDGWSGRILGERVQ